MGELGADVVVESLEAVRLEPVDVLVERVDEDPERQVAFELGGGSAEDELTALVRARRELREQAGLADSGLADELDRCGATLFQVGEELVERAELRGTSDEMLGNGHLVRPRRG